MSPEAVRSKRSREKTEPRAESFSNSMQLGKSCRTISLVPSVQPSAQMRIPSAAGRSSNNFPSVRRNSSRLLRVVIMIEVFMCLLSHFRPANDLSMETKRCPERSHVNSPARSRGLCHALTLLSILPQFPGSHLSARPHSPVFDSVAHAYPLE